MAFFKCELLVGGYSYEVTDCLVNWDDVELAYKRGDYDGVVRSFSTKFEFAGAAYSLLVGEYRSHYLQSSAHVVFYNRTNSWEWAERFRCALDFSTLAYTATTCEINAVDDSLASLIKAKRGTEYEYSVKNIKDGPLLLYDRMMMKNSCKWLLSGSEEEVGGEMRVVNRFAFNTPHPSYYTFPLYIESSELPVKNIASVSDLSGMEFVNEIPEYLFKNVSDKNITIHVSANFNLHFHTTGNGGMILFFRKYDKDGNDETILRHDFSEGWNEIDIDDDYQLEPSEYLFLFLAVSNAECELYQLQESASDERFSVEFSERDKAIRLDVVKPQVLLNRLLRSMNGGNSGISGHITTGVDARLDNTLLLAAESVRGLENAKLRTSYTKFCNWMSAEFGFVPVVDDAAKQVTFVHRDSLFKDTEVKDLGDGCTEFEYAVNEGLIYARVRVGYDKVDYDSVNGRDEFRWTNSYETGVTLTDTSLDLISPYRADAYGIEFLAAKRGEDTTDDGSDNDVFMVGAELTDSGTRYELIRGGEYAVSGVISPDTMFNAMYAQRFMVAANERYIGVFADGLAFASSEGNGDASVGGVRTDADLSISGGLFTVGEVEVETGDQQLPHDLGGYFTLRKNGMEYQGYLKETAFGVGKGKAVRYSLIVKGVADE